MAQFTTSTNTYAGKRYAQYFTPAILPKKGLVDRGIVTLAEGMKNQLAMLGVDKSLEFQNPSALFTASVLSPDIVRDEKKLNLVKYEVMDQIDYSNVLATWESEQLKKGSKNDRIPPAELADFVISKIYVPKLGIMNEMLYILGKAGVKGVGSATFSAAYPGLLPLLESDATVNKFPLPASAQKATTGVTSGANAVVTVANTDAVLIGDKITFIGLNGTLQIGGVTINGQSAMVIAKTATTLTTNVTTTGTAATSGIINFVNQLNVMEVLSMVYGVVDDKHRVGDEDAKARILVGTDIEKAYRLANGIKADGAGLMFRDPYFDYNKLIPFLDMDIEAMPYWKPNTIAVWAPKNVFLGTDVIGDEVEAQILWLGDTTGDQVYRYRNSMKSDVNYKYGNEITLVRPA